jgi:alcohol dehydrogenase class IV
MQVLDYKEQARNIVWGENSIKKLPEILNKNGSKKIMLVVGKSINSSVIYESIRILLGDSFVDVFDGVRAHVPQDSVEAGVALARSLKVDGLISVGGGSAIDTAKAINMILTEGDDYNKLQQTINDKGDIVSPSMLENKLFHIAIPTTLSAAECTGITGVTMLDSNNKSLFFSPSLAPQCIIYDPLVTLKTPEELWFTTALRTLDHAIERSYSLATNPLNDSMCLESIKLIFKWLPKNLKKKDDTESRLMLMHAAFLSMAGPSTTCLSHAIGHQLGPRYKNPRFDSTPVTQPAVMAFNRSFSSAKQKDMAVAMGLNVFDLSDEEAAILAEKAVTKLIKSINDSGISFPTRIRDTGISESDISIIASAVWQSPRLKVNPRPVKNKEEIEGLLKDMW